MSTDRPYAKCKRKRHKVTILKCYIVPLDTGLKGHITEAKFGSLSMPLLCVWSQDSTNVVYFDIR